MILVITLCFLILALYAIIIWSQRSRFGCEVRQYLANEIGSCWCGQHERKDHRHDVR